MDELRFVAYCGLYCKLCAQCGRIPRQAQALQQSLDREGYPQWGASIPNFASFWAFLSDLTDPDKQSEGCRSGACGYPFCEIRKCALNRGIEVCPFCAEYPCSHITELAAIYPTLLADGQRLREMGLEAWVEIQEARAATGFTYADIRYD